MVEDLTELERRRVAALARQSAREYYHLCGELGIEPEDNELYEQGAALANREKRGSGSSDLERSLPEAGNGGWGKNHEYWARLVVIAYRRFPYLSESRVVTSDQLNGRFAELRQAGYEVPPYSGLKKGGKWDLLRRLKKEIYAQARSNGAGYALVRIAEENERARDLERD